MTTEPVDSEPILIQRATEQESEPVSRNSENDRLLSSYSS